MLILEKFRQIFLKIQCQGPPVQDMPRRKLEEIKVPTITTEPVQSVTRNVFGPFSNFRRKVGEIQ